MRDDLRLNPRLASLLVLTASALSGCGAHASTKQDVIARGNQICETTAGAVRSLPPPQAGSLRSLARYYMQVTPLVATEIRQLRALPRPSQDRQLLDRYLGAIASSDTQYRALVAAARSGDRAALSSASAALRANPAARLAARYGISGCGPAAGTAP